VVLTVALLLLLVGASVLNFSSLQRGAQLDEGVGQLEYLFRLARATAAGTGRQVRVAFGAEAGLGSTNSVSSPEGIQATWDPDPLGAPGQFLRLAEAAPLAERLNELIHCRAAPVEPTPDEPGGGTSPSGFAPGGSTGLAFPVEGPTSIYPPPILFYPDGSSDAADLILVSVDPEDSRRARVRMAGLTGTVRRQWLAPESELGESADTAESSAVSRPPTGSPGSL